MPVDVKFCVQVTNGTDSHCVLETNLELDLENYLDEILKNPDRDGFIIISTPGQPDVRIQDELWAIVQNLCFIAIPDLIAHKNAVIRIYNNYGYVRMDPEATSVRLSGDGLANVYLNRKDLISSLYNCGERFILFIEKLKLFDPEYEEIILSLKEYAEMARQSIEDTARFKDY